MNRGKEGQGVLSFLYCNNWRGVYVAFDVWDRQGVERDGLWARSVVCGPSLNMGWFGCLTPHWASGLVSLTAALF
jgi:hypothetical protein